MVEPERWPGAISADLLGTTLLRNSITGNPLGFLFSRLSLIRFEFNKPDQTMTELFPSLLSRAEEHLSLLPPTPRPNLTLLF